ncbi:MAG: gamma-glutamylcyclotransferase [Wenzhouxiangellaceae bacterium]|nr:gamma-glutamylcyclotransferase [Wenzhouxiangellaceae bacterium]
MNSRPPFWPELKRRNVVRAGLAWLALSWLLIAIADLLFPYLGFPDEVIRALIVGLLITLLPVLVLAWLFELTPRGLRFDRGPGGENPENRRTGRRLDQLTIVLIRIGARRKLARTYRAIPVDPSLKPLDWYKRFVVHGAREHGLPDHYVAALARTPAIVDPHQQRRIRNLRIR